MHELYHPFDFGETALDLVHLGDISNWVVDWVNLDGNHVLISLEMLLNQGWELVVVLNKEGELGSVPNRLIVAVDFFEGTAHNGNDHVENDKQGDDCADYEDKPEDYSILFIFIACQLKVSESKAVRVNKTQTKAASTFIAWIDGVLIVQVEDYALRQHNSTKHDQKRQRVLDDLLQLADEACEEVNCSHSVEEFNQV